MLPTEIDYYQSIRAMFLSEDSSLQEILDEITDVMGNDFSYIKLNTINCSQSTPLSLFQELLISVNSTKQFLKLKHLQRVLNIPYASNMVELIYHTNPNQAKLGYLIRLYNNSAHLRDARNQTHIIETMIKLGWQDGLNYLLHEDPALINIGVIVINEYDKKKIEIDFLLNHVMNKNYHKSIIHSLLTPNLNLHLKIKDSSTLLHCLGRHEDKCQQYPEVLDWIFSRITIDMLNAADELGLTPITNAIKAHNEIFLRLCKKKYQEAGQDLDLSQVDYETTNAFKQPQEVQQKVLSYRFRGERPVAGPFEIFAACIGKGNDIKLFINEKFLIAYVNFMINQKKSDFMINGIMMTFAGAHGVNVILSRVNNGPVKALVIDSTGGQHAPLLNEVLRKAGIQTLSTVDKIQHTSTGCRIYATYLSGKLSHITLEEIEKLHQDFSKSNGKLHLHDLPIKFGVLGVCQSMSQIAAAQKIRQNLDPAEAMRPVNKRNEAFAQFLSRGTEVQYAGFVDLESKRINSTLSRKTKNREKHAQKFTALDHEKQMDAIADLLGFKELDPNWRVNIQNLLNENLGFSDLYHYELPNLTNQRSPIYSSQ